MNNNILLGWIVATFCGFILFGIALTHKTSDPEFNKADKEVSMIVNCSTEGVICK